MYRPQLDLRLPLTLLLSLLLACSDPDEQDEPATDAGNHSAQDTADDAPSQADTAESDDANLNTDALDASPDTEPDTAKPPDVGSNSDTDTDTTSCAEPNACGGCTALTAMPDDPCGPCLDGRLACDGTAALTCQGGSLSCQNEALRCDDLIDNDGNGLTDCLDPACDSFDACQDWSCVDHDLGSSLGRPLEVPPLTAHQGSFNGECLGEVPYRVFKWTAPYEGLFTFDLTINDNYPHPDDFPFFILKTSDCRSTSNTICSFSSQEIPDGLPGGRPLVSGSVGFRMDIPLWLEAGQSILWAVHEDEAILGVVPRFITTTRADIGLMGEARDSEINVNPIGHGETIVTLSPGEREHSYSHIYSIHRETRQATNLGHFSTPPGGFGVFPYSSIFDINNDGTFDLIQPGRFSTPTVEWSTRIYDGPPPGASTQWLPSTIIPSVRPSAAFGELTGDSVEDIVSWVVETDPSSGNVTKVDWALWSNTSDFLDSQTEPTLILAENASISDTTFSTAGVCDFNADGAGDLFLLAKREGITHAFIAYGPINSDYPSLQDLGEWQPSYGFQQKPFELVDLDSDGRCDIVLSSPEENKVHDFYSPFTSISHEEANWTLTPGPSLFASNRGILGYSFAAGDLNGDGYQDLVVGAPEGGDSGHGENQRLENSSAGGYILVFLGPFTPQGEITTNLADLSIGIRNYTPTYTPEILLGLHVAISDIDSDGYSDLLFTEPHNYSTWIFYGHQNVIRHWSRVR